MPHVGFGKNNQLWSEMFRSLHCTLADYRSISFTPKVLFHTYDVYCGTEYYFMTNV